MAGLPPRVVIVSRPSELDELVARHGTREQARFFLAGLPRRTRAHAPQPLARRRERRMKARDLIIDLVVIDDALRHLGHLPQQEVHLAQNDAGRRGNAVELVLHYWILALMPTPPLLSDSERRIGLARHRVVRLRMS